MDPVKGGDVGQAISVKHTKSITDKISRITLRCCYSWIDML